MKIIDSFSGEYEFLSNFYDHEIFYDGRRWARNENAYQAAKTDDEVIKSAIWMATAAKSKRIGKSIKPLRPNWKMIRIFVMRDLVHIKFDDPMMELQFALDVELFTVLAMHIPIGIQDIETILFYLKKSWEILTKSKEWQELKDGLNDCSIDVFYNCFHGYICI